MRQVRKGGTTAQYTYNAEGIRTAKTVNGETTQFILDGGNVIGEVNPQNQVTNYIRGASGIILSRDQSNTTKYYVTNGHGDVTNLTNTSGTVIKSYTYDAFGIEQNIDSNDTNPFRYCGEYFDSETQSIYLRARYYSPAVGRFTQQDPAMDGLNWYVYCASNPLRFADRTGLAPKDHDEFGKDSDIAKELDALGDEWNATTDKAEREKIQKRAELLRQLARKYINRGNTDQKKLLKGYHAVIDNESHIKAMAEAFGVNPHLIATTLFREVTMSSWDDATFIEMGAARIGADTSIGLAQIKVSRATEAYDNLFAYIQGDSYKGHNISTYEFARLLNDPEGNIRFLTIILWDTMHSRGIWDEESIYADYNGSSVYGEGSMEYSPYFWDYFN